MINFKCCACYRQHFDIVSIGKVAQNNTGRSYGMWTDGKFGFLYLHRFLKLMVIDYNIPLPSFTHSLQHETIYKL